MIIAFLIPKISILWHKIAFWDKDQHERGMGRGEIYGFRHEKLDSLLKDAGFKIIERKSFS